ncbi:NADP-dependent isocitrate dehydrogenase [Flavobacteriaceae bacterium TP-CH-4]|uniref:Isocitrate dehydrogenase [NADP] n=1 Tax=Pelagihabitans pacificus TaxID=2696054 RepID=A0A967AX06_9FLAO|nr:NADP-dependent isocitrate dehydrogenase [Pelagihabitans pacificus]NHF60685.1 NADP-dependent isocitrate dehydrogenase [Pelagihabitans pacificus]
MNIQVAAQGIENKRTIKKVKIAVAHGDGIGPEIMDATLKIMEAAGAQIVTEPILLGEQAYLAGNTSGIAPETWEALHDAKVILKSPITTPQGKGYKSLNVTLRKTLGLYANVRPVRSLSPYIHTHFPKMDVVVVRENEEDLYAGIEHQQTQDVVQCLKLITRPGCEKIVRYAFEYARLHDRKKVTCMLKDNIMKLTDGLFHRVFDEIAAEYPNIKSETQIIDIGAARLAARPEEYDVIVTSNLYGDIVSDIVAEIAGSVGMAGSANIGFRVAMFEAIHGSAPDIAGQNVANPSGLLNAAIMMLRHVGQTEVAKTIEDAWLTALEGGHHTADIYQEGVSVRKVSTSQFAEVVIACLGQEPQKLKSTNLVSGAGKMNMPSFTRKALQKELVGVDVFIDWQGSDPEEIGKKLSKAAAFQLKLKMITNRGVKVYPNGSPETFCTDHWRCRFVASNAQIDGTPIYEAVEYESVIALLSKLHHEEFDVIKTENLYQFDGQRGFSLGQGE